jgi:pterin-4a-carbinolamine dehydratase
MVMKEVWRKRERPLCLEGRFEFNDYESLRDFLDRVAELSDREGYYPDMGFGKDYVNFTIHAKEGEKTMDESLYEFARQLEKLV